MLPHRLPTVFESPTGKRVLMTKDEREVPVEQWEEEFMDAAEEEYARLPGYPIQVYSELDTWHDHRLSDLDQQLL